MQTYNPSYSLHFPTAFHMPFNPLLTRYCHCHTNCVVSRGALCSAVPCATPSAPKPSESVTQRDRERKRGSERENEVFAMYRMREDVICIFFCGLYDFTIHNIYFAMYQKTFMYVSVVYLSAAGGYTHKLRHRYKHTQKTLPNASEIAPEYYVKIIAHFQRIFICSLAETLSLSHTRFLSLYICVCTHVVQCVWVSIVQYETECWSLHCGTCTRNALPYA